MLEVALARLPQLVGTFRVVGVYLRETKRRNRDGSTVAYLQLAHSERHPVTGVPLGEGDPRHCHQVGERRGRSG